MSKLYLDYLLTLSADPNYTDDRRDELQKLSNEELGDLIKDLFASGPSRYACETVAGHLLDECVLERVRQGAPIWVPQSAGKEQDTQASSKLDLPLSSQSKCILKPVSTTTPRKRTKQSESLESGEYMEDGNEAGLVSDSEEKRDTKKACKRTTASAARNPPNIPNLEMTFFVGEKYGKGAFKTASELDGDTVDAIMQSFEEAYMSDEVRQEKYAIWYRRIKGGNQNHRCVNNLVYIGGAYPPRYKNALGDSKRACDSCMNTKRLCVKLIKMRGQEKLAVYPLPEARRRSKDFNNLAYWLP